MNPITKAAGILLLTLMVTIPSTAQDYDKAVRTVSVSGEGVVDIQPDMAIVYFGIVTSDEDPEKARANNASASRDAMNAVRELGVDERKIRLEQLRLEPERRYNDRTRNWEEIGFMATRTVRVELDDLDKLPQLIAELVQKGANRLDRIQYDISDRESVRREALQLAAMNARLKAEVLAETLGAGLGGALTIAEQGVSVPRPEFALAEARSMAMKDAAPEPEAYASGEIEVRATVNVTFWLTDKD